jgi:hypothetical protein
MSQNPYAVWGFFLVDCKLRDALLVRLPAFRVCLLIVVGFVSTVKQQNDEGGIQKDVLKTFPTINANELKIQGVQEENRQ